MNDVSDTIPGELLALAEQQPTTPLELRRWCQDCFDALEKLELRDARTVTANALHEHAALLVRNAAVYVRRCVDRKKADQMPWVRAKCVSHALIRFQECIEWCDSRIFELSPPSARAGTGKLGRAKERAYQSSVVAAEILCADGASVTDREMYDYLREELDEESGYRLPRYETWERYVREGREYHGTQKNSSPAGRSGKSLVRNDQI